MSASGLVIMSCSPNAQANILPLPSLPDAITSVYNTHFTYTSHPKETLLSSAFYSLPENSGRVKEDFKPSLPLPKSLGREKEKVNMSSLGLTRGFKWNEEAVLSDLDTPVKPEYDREKRPEYDIGEKRTVEDNLFVTLTRSLRSDLSPLIGRGKKYKVEIASVCFVTDTNDCSGNEFSGNNADDNGHGAPGGNEADNGNQDDYELDNAERCKKEGYNKTSCLPGETAENFCLYDSNYFEKCVCPDGYKTCTPPYYGVGTACGNKYASCEKDTQRACKELNPNYTNACGTGQQLSDNRCSYDSSYGTCCNTCSGYDNTTIPDGYVQDGEACVDCNGQTKYKIKINPCDGFLDCGSMGPDTGAKTCLSGTTTKYSNCKPCPNKGTLTSCPSPYTCTYEACSNRYYKSGCKSGYDWNASSQTCTAQCSSSYKYTCKGENEKGSGEVCNGKYKSCKCIETGTFDCYVWNGSACVKGACLEGSLKPEEPAEEI